jgi:hypothetical protein
VTDGKCPGGFGAIRQTIHVFAAASANRQPGALRHRRRQGPHVLGGRRIWRRIQKRSGVKRLGSHLIRHTYGQNMAQQRATISEPMIKYGLAS